MEDLLNFLTDNKRKKTFIKNTFKAEYLSHLKDKWTEGLSVNTTLDWAIGSVLCFDSLALHCSTDFTNKGIERKIGLSIFTICK